MGQVRKCFEKTEGGWKGFCKPKNVFCKPEKDFAKFEGARFFFAKVVPHPQVLIFCIPHPENLYAKP